jgi:hypothetical protein
VEVTAIGPAVGPAIGTRIRSAAAAAAATPAAAAAATPAPAAAAAVAAPSQTSCTFTVTLSRASGTVTLSPSSFAIVDEIGQVHRPIVGTRSGALPPSQIHPGQTVALTIRSVLPVGGGRITWAPASSSRPAVAWDFDVEIN